MGNQDFFWRQRKIFYSEACLSYLSNITFYWIFYDSKLKSHWKKTLRAHSESRWFIENETIASRNFHMVKFFLCSPSFRYMDSWQLLVVRRIYDLAMIIIFLGRTLHHVWPNLRDLIGPCHIEMRSRKTKFNKDIEGLVFISDVS